MDMDGDVDGSLSQALSCMATNDREVLIKQFQQFLGDNHTPSAETCTFFLDMNSWNLQAALGAYYDFGSANTTGLPPPEYTTQLPLMQFVQDVTIGEGESVPPSTRFTKTWRLRNSGNEWWPNGCYLGFMEGQNLKGDKLSDTTKSWIEPLAPGKEINVSVEMVSPAVKGIYQSRWQLNTSSGIPFGESIWCIITVDDMGILDITQQLASAPLGSSAPAVQRENINPFSGPFSFASAPKSSAAEHPDVAESNMDETSPSSSSCNTVVTRLPRVWSISECQFPITVSEPIDISHVEETPDVPPCTPCTPPQ